MNSLEELGRLYLEHKSLKQEYDNLLAMMGKVAAGEVRPDQISVDTTKCSWALKLTGPELAKELKVEPAEQAEPPVE